MLKWRQLIFNCFQSVHFCVSCSLCSHSDYMKILIKKLMGI